MPGFEAMDLIWPEPGGRETMEPISARVIVAQRLVRPVDLYSMRRYPHA